MDSDNRMENIIREYSNYLDDDEDEGIHSTLIKNMIDEKKTRLIVNINHLRKKNAERAHGLLNNTFEEQKAFQAALKQFVDNVDATYSKQHLEFNIGFIGSFGNKHVTPRTLRSSYLTSMICLEGIVTKCSLVTPKIMKSVHFCPATNSTVERTYTDFTSLDAFPSSAAYLTRDDSGNVLETEFGLSVYKDHQVLTIQERPEKAPVGQMPRSVDVVCDNDLVDLCKPGDRVQIVGSYRTLPSKQNGYTSGTFRNIVIANNIIPLVQEKDIEISHEDVKKCKRLAKRNSHTIFELLSKSLAPSIYGHEYEKKAILLMLLGGTEKHLPNGTRLRGDINVLLIGDPSVAKSQLLRYVLCTAPRAIPTTGRGSSGVGLTAAVTMDPETNDRRLEAGAMVLADRGVICIDEFDKMTDIDRTAIHEVMEQGRVTIAKAGIHATLNARCSVLAAANPVYGKYNQHKTPMENIGLQDSLLSRFDLLFVMLDTIDSELDTIISDHVVRMHMYRNPMEQDGEALAFNVGADILSTRDFETPGDQDADNQIYERYDPLLHGNLRSKTDKILTVSFMRKYIQIAKCIKPELTDAASEVIAEAYTNIRSDEKNEELGLRTQVVTARTLETLIRLSTAHAKARLSRTVDVEDANAAVELMQYAYFKRVAEKDKKKRKRRASGDDVDTADETVASQERPKRSRRERSATQEEYDSADDTHVDEAVLRGPESAVVEGVENMEVDSTISDERLKLFREHLNKMFTEKRTQSLPMREIPESLNKVAKPHFKSGEISAALKAMSEENQVMVDEQHIYLI